MLPLLRIVQASFPRAFAIVLLPVSVVVGFIGVTAEEYFARDKQIRDNQTPKTAYERREERQYASMIQAETAAAAAAASSVIPGKQV